MEVKDVKAEQLSSRPGIQADMQQQPKSVRKGHSGTGKLADKVAIVTGGDSGIGRAVAVAFAKEGSKVVVTYLNEHQDAEETKRLVAQEGGECVLVAGDVGNPGFSTTLIESAVSDLGRLDIIVNNAAEQHPQEEITQISDDQLERTFRTNVFSMFYIVRAAMPHLKAGASIINTASVTAYEGNPMLLDYSSTKGAIISFTRALSHSLAPKGIRVNAVAPGPIWTPLIPSTFPPEKVEKFGKDVPLGRPGQPEEVAPAFVFLASAIDSAFITGQTIHVNGGKVVNG
jgi:NAD(P)-dependent dehydrogenase (short-subunit alcohol dehydrogenase family)